MSSSLLQMLSIPVLLLACSPKTFNDKNQQGSSQKFKQLFIRRTGKLLETKLYCKNLIKTDKHLGCSPCKILGTILEVNGERTSKMDQRTRKLTSMHKTLYPRDDVDWCYVSRKGGRVFSSIKDIVDASIQRLEYLKKKVRRNIDYNDNEQYTQHKLL